ncbi:hypothetical protein NM208_g13366 [Fusarium decemcellulare]|uniref:Uncharacterized protein n=1 Tax=Fusarium decemcellulare TaxID=57161 RepID=A0ACC1RPF7_9HYPO|nr:hypothetical protein NM208_g13366 [Fusarium decemcellulare]
MTTHGPCLGWSLGITGKERCGESKLSISPRYWVLPVTEHALFGIGWLFWALVRNTGLARDSGDILPLFHHPSSLPCSEISSEPGLLESYFGFLGSIPRYTSWILPRGLFSSMALANPPTLSPGVAPGIHTSRHSNWAATGLANFSGSTNPFDSLGRFYDTNLNAALDAFHINAIGPPAALESIGSQREPPKKSSDSQTCVQCPRISTDYLDGLGQDDHSLKRSRSKRPFRKWMQSLQRRGSDREVIWDTDVGWEHIDSSEIYEQALRQRISRTVPSSESSLGFIAAVQSARTSLAGASSLIRSRGNHRRSHCTSRPGRSSRASVSAPRFSEDSTPLEKAEADLAAIRRSLQRRQVLEELINTEEGYIGDIRFLVNSYVTMLAALPDLPEQLRSSINLNLHQIIALHDEILGELHRVIPDSEYNQSDQLKPPTDFTNSNNGHRRCHSLDTFLDPRANLRELQSARGVSADPQVVAEVAKMYRFFIYKEYGAKYEKMIKSVGFADGTLPKWEVYQRGVESFVSCFGSLKVEDTVYKKALTVCDLLVKPVQRICKYPLLFSELLKCTPALDCPNSHMEVEAALVRLREATAEINRSTENDDTKAMLQKTWLLQDRIVFPERRLDANSKNRIRSFGHIQLCGALHVCWQTEDSVEGQYMICLLYQDVLCLASGGKFDRIYTILACIDLYGIKLQAIDNGRGLQCHGAPFSWKIVFESDHQLYELIMTACNANEEAEWQGRLQESLGRDQDEKPPVLCSFLSLDIKSLGAVFGRQGTIARRMSFHRATAVGPNSPLFHVILKGTSAVRPGNSTTAGLTGLNRSQSLLSTRPRIPVLAPSRSERARLEMLLEDVWSQDIIPLPGMTSIARNEQMVRRSASTMMRKLSVASMSKRSESMSRRGNEDATSDGLARKTSKSSESGLIRSGQTDCESSDSNPKKSTSISEAKEMNEERDCMPVVRSPRLGLTPVSEVRTVETTREEKLKKRGVVPAPATSSHRRSSSQSSRKTGIYPRTNGTTENSSPLTKIKMQSNSNRWVKVKSPKNEKKGHRFRRFFGSKFYV